MWELQDGALYIAQGKRSSQINIATLLCIALTIEAKGSTT